MLSLFRESLLEYANSRWGRRIFVWSSIAILLGAIVLGVSLGINSSAGSAAASSKFATLFAAVIALPVLIVFNLALALLWATGRTVGRLLDTRRLR